MRAFSYGGGWQSTAALVLAAQGRIDFPTFLFANVGDDSEHPATLRYIRDHAAPYAAAHGIDLRELHRIRRDGTTETLYGRLTREGSRSIPIPVRMS
ncbi:phosphoadenosine phosphosulfate reductase, partial [Actinomadura sp. 7K534]